tara:strand:+ start:1336 stop:1527 length:192 start_codon:yes stop_codon:yes gene_type:complete
MTEAEILTFVNSDEFWTPEAKTGDICWFPPGKANIIAGDSLKLIYNSSDKWEKHSNQNHAYTD